MNQLLPSTLGMLICVIVYVIKLAKCIFVRLHLRAMKQTSLKSETKFLTSTALFVSPRQLLIRKSFYFIAGLLFFVGCATQSIKTKSAVGQSGFVPQSFSA